MKERKPREYTPITGTWADPEKVVCKDCAFRDRTVVELFGKRDACGVTRDTCDIYAGPPEASYKPSEILLHNGPCQYYTKETKAIG